jgi:DeoR/GlpR family transcriptional regulator of sugar metabolism
MQASHEPALVGSPRARWTFLTNHAHVLIALTRDPSVRVRDLAAAVGITERAVQQILSDLESGLVITRERHGRRNSYRVNPDVKLRHPMEARHRVGELLSLAD